MAVEMQATRSLSRAVDNSLLDWMAVADERVRGFLFDLRSFCQLIVFCLEFQDLLSLFEESDSTVAEVLLQNSDRVAELSELPVDSVLLFGFGSDHFVPPEPVVALLFEVGNSPSVVCEQRVEVHLFVECRLKEVLFDTQCGDVFDLFDEASEHG